MKPNIVLKTSIEVARIRRSCRIASWVLDEIEKILEPGITTSNIDTYCKTLILQKFAMPAQLAYRGFPGVSCISVNHVAAHGIPNHYTLEEGDVVTVDLAVLFEGWYGDTARSYIVGKASVDAKRVLKAAFSATQAGIAATKAGGRLGDIGWAIQRSLQQDGCVSFPHFVGHGIGRKLHEDPVILHHGEPGTGLPIVPGMVFTIEPVVSLGCTKTKKLEDGWTVISEDGKPCAQFEHTVAVFGNRTEILSQGV